MTGPPPTRPDLDDPIARIRGHAATSTLSRHDAADDDDVHDELTALFLGGRVPTIAPPPSRTAGPASPASTTPIEAPFATQGLDLAILGHLPVRANVWLRQYAAAVTLEDAAPATLLRVSAGSLHVELIDPPPGDHARGHAHAALQHAATSARRHIVAADEGDQLQAAVASPDARVTILTAANDAAIIHAYRLLKALAGASTHRGAGPAPQPRLCVVGEDLARAAGAAERLRSAAQRFLNLAVEIGPFLPRVEAGRAALIFAGPAPGSVHDVLSLLRAAGERSTSTAPIAPAHRPPATAPASPVTLNPADRGRDLCRWIEGAIRLDVRCPEAPGVELALGADGRPMVVGSEADLLGVHAASAWWWRHAGILARALPGAPATFTTIDLHIVTRDERAWRVAAQAGLNAHWITRVTVDGKDLEGAVRLLPAP